ncbi:MAG: hypothetical protein M3120_05805 [Pseudomonadota bacterium]|nr:hypothetical protein [Pseudomonadota bacterium]
MYWFPAPQYRQGPEVDPAAPTVTATLRDPVSMLAESVAVSTSAGASPTSLQIIDMIEQATQDLLATPEDTPLPNEPSDWRAVNERRENMSFIPVAVG